MQLRLFTNGRISGKSLFLRKVDLNLNKTILLTVLPIIILKANGIMGPTRHVSDRYSYLRGSFQGTLETLFPRGWEGQTTSMWAKGTVSGSRQEQCGAVNTGCCYRTTSYWGGRNHSHVGVKDRNNDKCIDILSTTHFQTARH